MLCIDNVELLHRIHAGYWVVGRTSGPTMQELLEGVVEYDPRGDGVWVNGVEWFKLGSAELRDQIIRSEVLTDRHGLGIPLERGRVAWLTYMELGDECEGLAMSLGDGVWLLEDGYEVWFWEIVDWKGVEVVVDDR